MWAFLSKTKEVFLDILFPPICASCEKSLKTMDKEDFICKPCLDSIEISNTLTCSVCGARMAYNTKTCHKDSAYRLIAASTYDNKTIRRLIWKLKYEKKTYTAKPIAKIMADCINNVDLNLDKFQIMPLPLHKNRERERGFNQSQIIAKSLSSSLNLKSMENTLIRIKNTKSQADTKNFEDRKKNMENSFTVTKSELIQGKNILLVDDVFTSGSTINEAVRTLKIGGANKIIALVSAKAGF